MFSRLLEPLARFCLELISKLGYAGIVAVMAIENVFPPIPSELVMPFTGFLSSQGRFNFVIAVLMGVVGSVLGAVFWYYFGYFGDELFVRNFLRRFGKYLFISEKDLDSALGYFEKRGEIIIFTGRLIPIIRSLISIPAGLAKMSLGRFFFFTILGTSIWTFILTFLGKILGNNWQTVGEWLKKYEYLVLVVLLLAIIYFFYRRLKSQRPYPTQPS